jgi:hypothetical protein
MPTFSRLIESNAIRFLKKARRLPRLLKPGDPKPAHNFAALPRGELKWRKHVVHHSRKRSP